jgi:hypothetical protein
MREQTLLIVHIVHAAWVADMMKELLKKDTNRVRQPLVPFMSWC